MTEACDTGGRGNRTKRGRTGYPRRVRQGRDTLGGIGLIEVEEVQMSVSSDETVKIDQV